MTLARRQLKFSPNHDGGINAPIVHEPLRKKLVQGKDFKIVRLDASTVSSNPKNVAREGKERGEKHFQGMLRLLKDNFPASEIESETQFRAYFHDEYSCNWFVNVAVNKANEVTGICLYSYSKEANLIMYNIVAVDKQLRRMGVGASLVNAMVKNSKNSNYVMAEIEQPHQFITGEEGQIRNVVRPAFHDTVSKVRAIRLPDGNPLIYILPIMASDEERAEAKRKGEPLEPEPLMFCLRPLKKSENDGISSKETARLLIWFYKDYLEGECSDVKREEVNEFLALTLARLSDSPKTVIEKSLKGGRKNDEKIIGLVPEKQLSFMKVSETAD